ncbi:hypothetical protein [Blackfly microvirus SF02]|uniref:Uncharacterized protein n=1 Tax=Blackfly microvirus SF02 TaxID=2576452 RepID=A0A4P8PS30_9VIRU|nr:hypothetical protein [Blackfly microvirus SF02]
MSPEPLFLASQSELWLLMKLLRLSSRILRRAVARRSFFKCYFFATMLLLCWFILVLSVPKSCSILSNIALNFGLDACIRLLLASAMLIESFSISSSVSLNIWIPRFMCFIAL